MKSMVKIYKESLHRRKQKQKYVNKNRPILNQKSLIRRYKNLQTWSHVLPLDTFCEICNKSIGFLNKKNPICFDHRHEGNEVIKCSPNTWLSLNRYSVENKLIWDSCDFGILCNRCNGFLPTKNRVDFLLKAFYYSYDKKNR